VARAPQRTCVACRRVEPKSRLQRIVRGADGRIRVDAEESAPGRGAYVHPAPACIAALDRGRIARALRIASGEDALAQSELGRLRNEIEEQMGAR
jgi:predicted RNA-binding protein YlxR (DUF448 family)